MNSHALIIENRFILQEMLVAGLRYHRILKLNKGLASVLKNIAIQNWTKIGAQVGKCKLSSILRDLLEEENA